MKYAAVNDNSASTPKTLTFQCEDKIGLMVVEAK